MRSAEYERMQSVECERMQNAECGVQSAECRESKSLLLWEKGDRRRRWMRSWFSFGDTSSVTALPCHLLPLEKAKGNGNAILRRGRYYLPAKQTGAASRSPTE